MSDEIHTYPGRPNWCPGALVDKRRVRHPEPVPVADLVREEMRGGIPVRVIERGVTGLCSSCAALERGERESRHAEHEEHEQPRRRRA